jgi:D-beta-D-heptose 7-phosphate kinase/D-beta-D-heptose 1-phosphate adenosyltransferase
MTESGAAGLPELFVSDRWKGTPVLTIGDVMLDRYLQGRVHRVSPEAPVPVVTLEREWTTPGGAGNVAACLAGLGCAVTVAGVVGDDAEAAALRRRLHELGVARTDLEPGAGARTICKTRVLGGPYHQLVRVDQDSARAAVEAAAEGMVEGLVARLGEYRAVVLSDYDKGTLTPRLIRAVLDECRRLKVPALVDPKRLDFALYAGATLLAPNVHEAERAARTPLAAAEAVRRAAVEMRRAYGLEYMVITQGADGMTLAAAGGVAHFPAEVREVSDVTGAGDTVMAVLAACLGSGVAADEACRLASVAAGIAVSHPGCYVVRAEELDNRLRGHPPAVLSRAAARDRVAAAQQAGRRVVFTNGCFDLLHPGHLSCLEGARRLGDVLVVGVNSDASVRALKGPERPVLTEAHRAAMLAGLRCVDVVVVFPEETPEELIRTLQPDVLVKGGDYDPATIVGADFVRGRGGQVKVLPLVPALSTTNILARQRDLQATAARAQNGDRTGA